MIFACCGARHCVPRHRLPSPRTSWPGLSAGISRNRLSGSLIRKPPRFWTASHKATGGVPIVPDVSDPAPLLCANTRVTDTRSLSCPVDTSGAMRLTRASRPLRTTSPALPGTAHVSLGYVLAEIVLKISRMRQREAMLALPPLDDCIVAASPLPAKRCDDEAKRTEGFSLRDLHSQVDRA